MKKILLKIKCFFGFHSFYTMTQLGNTSVFGQFVAQKLELKICRHCSKREGVWMVDNEVISKSVAKVYYMLGRARITTNAIKY